jgi:hypothetical protein
MSQATPDFSALLSRKADDVQRPWTLPNGTYTMLVKKYEFGVSEQKGSPRVRYTVTPISFDQDVDPMELEGKDWQNKTLEDDFYLSEKAIYRLVDFLEVCGVNTAGRQLEELVPEAVGRTFKAAVEVQANQKDPNAAGFNKITGHSRAE